MKICCIILALALGIISCEMDLESESIDSYMTNNDKPVNKYTVTLYSDNTGNFLLVDSENVNLTDIQVFSTRNPAVFQVAIRNSNAGSLQRFSFSDISSLGKILYDGYKLTKPSKGSFMEDIFFWAADYIFNEVVKNIKNNLLDSSKPTTSSIAENVAKRKKTVGARRWDMRPW